MKAVSRRETCLFCGVNSMSSLMLLAFFMCAATSAMAVTRLAAPDFSTWLESGIRLLTDSHYDYSTFYGERDLSAKLGIFDSLKIGTSEFRNVLVFISDRDNLLGLDLIGKLGRLKVTQKALELNAEPPARSKPSRVN